MNGYSRFLVLVALAGSALRAQAQNPSPAAPPNESMVKWAYFEPVAPAQPGADKYVDFLITPAVFDKARPDLNDLRLRDAEDREIPYALRIRREDRRLDERKAEEFNHVRLPSRADEVSLDLGAQMVPSNEIVLGTPGNNFRREVRIEGSDRRDGDWKVLVETATILRFEVNGQSLSNNRVRYPRSTFRYLRVRLSPDPAVKDDTPTIASVTIFESVQTPGEESTLAGGLGPRQAVPTNGGPGSAWDIDLGGANVPCSKLRFNVTNADFVRDYEVQLLPDDRVESPSRRGRRYGPGYVEYGPGYADYDAPSTFMGGKPVIASGQWRRRPGDPPKPVEITFSEVQARRLRLVVTDNRNPPLNIVDVQFSAAAREVVFATAEAKKTPLRLYFGNGAALPPKYEFADQLPTTITAERTQLEGSPQPNPTYHPEPPPWTERWPWLIYVVLGAASVVLIGILALLGREVIRRHDAHATPPSPSAA